MKVLKTLVAAAGLVFAAACSDTSNQMTGIEPSFSKKGKGGFGDPHFTTDNTVCTFNKLTGLFACDYQIAGLSANSSGAGKMEGNVIVGWSCSYSDQTKDYSSDKVGLEYDFVFYTDSTGKASGHVEDDSPSYWFNLQPSCSRKYINGAYEKPAPTDFTYYLDSHSSPLILPYLLEGQWSLWALVTTPKTLVKYIFYSGALVPEGEVPEDQQ